MPLTLPRSRSTKNPSFNSSTNLSSSSFDSHSFPSSSTVQIQQYIHRNLSAFGFDVPFLFLLAVFATATLFFFSMRLRGVELSFEQLTEYERRLATFENANVYLVEVKKPWIQVEETILAKFSPEDWAVISSEVDYIAFVYDKIHHFMYQEWVEAVTFPWNELATSNSFPSLSTSDDNQDKNDDVRTEKIKKYDVKEIEIDEKLQASQSKHMKALNHPFGITLFHCGCVIPNSYFEHITERFHGLECLLLPGFVFQSNEVFWSNISVQSTCIHRDSIMRYNVLKKYAKHLYSVRQQVEHLRFKILKI